MKISELTGIALNNTVHQLVHPDEPIKEGCTAPPYSADWAFGGPIIEREIVSIDKEEGGKRWAAYAWRSDRDLQKAIGPTPLIAAMRCFVASKLGDDIEVPLELK